MESQSKIVTALKSRTAWTILVTFILNGVPAIREFIPANVLPIVDAALGLLAIYFRVNVKAGTQQ